MRPRARARRWETAAAAAGDVLYFSSLLLHASHRNGAGSADRWALISTFRDAAVQDSSRPANATVTEP